MGHRAGVVFAARVVGEDREGALEVIQIDRKRIKNESNVHKS